MSVTFISSVLCCALALPHGGGDSEPAGDSSDAVARAEAAYLEKDYAAASQAFAEAYAVDPNPVFLYARAQAERLAGRCDVALELYDRYIDAGPAAGSVQEAKINRARCERATERPPPPAAPNPKPSASLAVDEPQARPWYRDPVGGSLVGVGAVTTAIGGGLLGIALANDGGAPGSATEGEFIDAKDDSRVRHRIGISLVSVGAALVIAGAIRWAIVARNTRGIDRTSSSSRGLAVRF